MDITEEEVDIAATVAAITEGVGAAHILVSLWIQSHESSLSAKSAVMLYLVVFTMNIE
jgi:hypothetical protein